MKSFLLVLVALALLGCDRNANVSGASERSVEPVSVAALDPVYDAQARHAEEQLSQICPALSKLQSANEIESVSHTIGAPNMDTQRALGWRDAVTVEVVLKIPLRSVPAEWHASGHHCYFEVGTTGVTVSKSPCMRICDMAPEDTLKPFAT